MSAKDDILKQIDNVIKQNKALSKDLSRERTIAKWACEFFSEVDSVKGDRMLVALALSKFTSKLKPIDKKVSVVFKEPLNGDSQIEIRWSKKYLVANNCESVMVLDSSAAFFQDVMEQI